ncbi:MAG TPA: helicase-related protein [Candidatus Absconditabacterales bacterium]|nr:helicase-related protein [Candidatus Absconditabacterales bacterium]HNG96954.1 helicase-related protein [Candidatus Absconditabacterales bacterium]
MSTLSDYLQSSHPQNGPVFIDHLFDKINHHIGQGGKILILALTKKSSEEISNFLISKGFRAYYLHSEISTIERWEIIKKLRSGQIDILVGVNLLREGIDLPEVSLIAILDADKEGFLRSTTSLVQIIGRAARNPHSEVILYGDSMTESMIKALYETYRRRSIQITYNQKHNITPTKALSNVKNIESVKTDQELQQDFTHLQVRGSRKKLKKLTKAEKSLILDELGRELQVAIANREFEKAAIIRDQIKEMEE